MCQLLMAYSFHCGEAYHLPADCECYRKWLIKSQDDSETANYILANTKDVSMYVMDLECHVVSDPLL